MKKGKGAVMLHAKDILTMAQACREMASKTNDLKLKAELTERAERYEIVASAVQEQPKQQSEAAY